MNDLDSKPYSLAHIEEENFQKLTAASGFCLGLREVFIDQAINHRIKLEITEKRYN